MSDIYKAYKELEEENYKLEQTIYHLENYMDKKQILKAYKDVAKQFEEELKAYEVLAKQYEEE